jgi:hypothetical protein
MDMLHDDHVVNNSFAQTAYPTTSTFNPTARHDEFTLSGFDLPDDAQTDVPMTDILPHSPTPSLCEAATSTVERNACSQQLLEDTPVPLATPDERSTQADQASGKRPRVLQGDSTSREPIPKIAKELQPGTQYDPETSHHSNLISPTTHPHLSPPVPLSRSHLSSASTPSPSTFPNELSCMMVPRDTAVEAAVKHIGQKPQLKMAIKTRKSVASILQFLT